MKDIIRAPTEYTTISIKRAYQQFLERRSRLLELDMAYSTGYVSHMSDREKETTTPYIINNCKVIADTKSSYIAGIPPTYSASDEDPKGQEIVELYREQVKPQLDQEITNACSRFGRGFEVCFNEQTVTDDMVTITPKSVAVSPLECFVAYDFSLDPDSVFGAIRYVEVDDQQVEHVFLDIYDRYEVVRFALTGQTDTGSWSEVPGTRRPHGFDRVPIIEYRNNPDCSGDFTAILPLQRAINEILSDRVRDKNKFASSILISKGMAFGDTDDEVSQNMGRIKGEEYAAVPKDADLYYLTKTFDEASVQILVDSIDSQMHKVSGIPDMTDESFASNASGVAIKYKLLALNNLAQSFVSQFERGFMRRCKLYSYALFGKDGADVPSMRVTFRFNLPNDSAYDAQTMEIYMRNSALSKQTMMENCPYINDVAAEQARLATEADEADARMERAETDYLQLEGQRILDEEPDMPEE